MYANGLCPKTSKDVGWTGVECTFGEVTSISLSSFNIAGSIPNEIFTLSTLEVLDLHANAFTGSLPPSLSRSLRSLDLSFNS